jgi:alpha-L-rhamnosidase
MRFALLLLLLTASAFASPLVPVALRCEYLANPLAVEDAHPRLGWTLRSETPGQHQRAWAVRVASSLEKLQYDKPDLWDSGKTEGGACSQLSYLGKPLKPGQQVFWQAKVWNTRDEESPWSETATWRAGLSASENWVGTWIAAKDDSPVHKDRDSLHLPPARYFRTEFEIAKPVRRATAYLSALGLADLHLNGKSASDAQFLPGWSDYTQRAYYRALDVTALLRPGPNAVGAILTDGWYAGYVGYGLLVGYGPHKTGRSMYGKSPALLAQIQVEFEDGTKKSIGTGKQWKVTNEGPLREADLLMGESYDARRELVGWDIPGFDASRWANAIPAEANGSAKAPFFDNCGEREVELGFRKPAKLEAYPAPPVRVTEELAVRKITEPSPGTYIFDFGTNFAGCVRLRVKGPAGGQVRLRFGEMLHPDGSLMTENLRKARATDFYTLRGSSDAEEWRPQFTYHGFQYCEVTGLPEKPTQETLRGLVLQSATPMTSSFECSDQVLNQLYANIVRSQRSNFLEIPTDCPQRDERLGWMGDAQIYVRAATYAADVAAFFTKWLGDVRESQRSFGAYPDYAPYPMGNGEAGKTFGAAWTDAGVICPHTIWKVYGDTRLLERHWESMVRFMAFRQAASPSFQGVSIGNAWGDWLNLKDPTPIELIDAAYFAHSSQLMAEMAEALQKPDQAQHYRETAENVKRVFVEKYLQGDGTLRDASQTACVLALQFNLLPQSKRGAVTGQLVKLVESNGHRMTTGFLGTKSILPALSGQGKQALAIRLLQSREYPSWCYPVVHGATSVWERWDSYSKEKGFGSADNAAMNSFSQYSFGAVLQWMFQSLAGIDTDGPGYRKILLKPVNPLAQTPGPQSPLSWVKASYDSPAGLIKAAWSVHDRSLEYRAEIPPNTTATLYLPSRPTETVTVNGKPLGATDGVRFLRFEDDAAVFALEPGSHTLISQFTE